MGIVKDEVRNERTNAKYGAGIRQIEKNGQRERKAQSVFCVVE